jgi:hypothetical protein
MKRALNHEVLFNKSLGHVICPHAATNLSKAVYSEVSEEEIKANYPKCLEYASQNMEVFELPKWRPET